MIDVTQTKSFSVVDLKTDRSICAHFFGEID